MGEPPATGHLSVELQEEAQRILELAQGDLARAFDHVERQHTTLTLRTQVLLSLCGIVITVTGFSGRIIAASGLLAKISVIVGLFVVLCAAALAVWGVLRVRWLTQYVRPDALETVERCLLQRESKTRYLQRALILFVLGFAFYCIAIALMLATAR